MALFRKTTIRNSQDLERIQALPRRRWSAEQMDVCAAHYTQQLKTPGGTMALRPLQGVAIHEMTYAGGLLGPIRVGGGKTLISFLAAVVFRAMRPVLLLPASLIVKTQEDMGKLMRHWQIPRNIYIQSYETLGRENAAEWLQEYGPDLIITDESHKLKNLKAGVTRRVKRYMMARPSTRFVAISGTLYRDDLEDFGHLAAWALKGNSPAPLDDGQLKEWSTCMSHQSNPLNNIDPGPLLQLVPPEPEDQDPDVHAMARKVFRRRLLDSYGVVASTDDQVACSLYLKGLTYKVNEVTESNFKVLRTRWETPDGWTLSEAVDVWRTAQQLALGFHYIWDPRPPAEWMEARRNWAQLVRSVIGHSRRLDTEKTVRNAIVLGEFHHEHCRLVDEEGRPCPCHHAYHPDTGVPGIDLWREWERIQPTFQTNVKAIWHDTSALELCEQWAKSKEGPGIIWTSHSFFARELARRTGLPYFGEHGLSADGLDLSKYGDAVNEGTAKPTSLIASIKANSAGRNLQGWARNLITCPPAGATDNEQLLGRTHRDGQLADTVQAEYMIGCIENWDAIDKAIAAATASEQTMGHAQKLLIGDKVFPSEGTVLGWSRKSHRWDKSGGVQE